MATGLTARIRPGVPIPLGATWDGTGTNFALYSEDAKGVELCLFDDAGDEIRVPVRDRTEFVWHIRIDGVGPGQLYGYRVDGPWEPTAGLRFNRNNVLLDPYARAVSGTEDWSRGAYAYDLDHPDRDLARSEADARGAPLGVVVDPAFDWQGDAPPNTPLRNSIIYEAHVKGLTMRHPEIPAELRGCYTALASEPIIRHLRELGVTAVELLPVHQRVDDQFLVDRGLSNYWGYNTIGFFAPEVRYRCGDERAAEVRQFKEMVRSLHAAGIEVILDVVYNHTAEGNHLGPTLSFKGIDNRTYYRLVADEPRFYFDYTGTGNSLNVRHPQTLRMIMDSLRYWVQEMHVDGFRFDLASTLARSLHEVDKLSAFFAVINQDPVIGQVKLIAEPWDVGEGGYQVGQFPVRWAEWNGKFRDAMRAFWRGDGGLAGELGYRITGSADLYQPGGRRPAASINLITAHDGFTLRDLVTYNDKHNQANGEDNRDGATDNASWNCGVEGETDDPEIQTLRWRQMRNLLASLMLSQGTPMLTGGDEMGRTQRGNNNAYCQDSELSWHDWEPGPQAEALLAFTRKLSRLRREHPLFRRPRYAAGRAIRGVDVTDMIWFRHDGQTMTDADWNDRSTSSLGVFFAGAGIDATDEQGHPLTDDDLLLLFNAAASDLDFVLPAFSERASSHRWELLLDTADDRAEEAVEPGRSTPVRARSLKLFARRGLAPGGMTAAHGAPTSTYRLQLHGGFGFRDAAGVVDYLVALGVGGVYSSPWLRAESGSTHGYNVADHSQLNPELGSDDDHRAWTAAIRERGLEHLMDFVPNHVGVGSCQSPWWLDVLENGPSSEYADFFDIEWESPAGPKNKVLLPLLGGQFGAELEAGKFSIVRDGALFHVVYGERRLPASLRSYRMILERAADQLELPPSELAAQELGSIVSALAHLPPPTATSLAERTERGREKQVIKRRLAALYESSTEVAGAVDRTLTALNGDIGALEQVLLEQNYRLSYWRVAAEEINYRRFFDVNELAAIRMEDPRVFEAAHQLVFRMLAEGRVTGLRLDHTDGLYDPAAYFQALQQRARQALAASGRPVSAPVYLLAEKILEADEELPPSWSIAGTTGYDFLGAANGVWVDPAAQGRINDIYHRFAGAERDYRRIVHEAKRTIMESTLSSEMHMLAHALKRIAEGNRHARDFTFNGLLHAIEETVAAMPVYRTYVRPDGSRSEQDERYIRGALERARRRNRTLEPSIFEFLAGILLLEDRSPEAVDFAMRFQQLTAPVMAKGVEDTALYRFHRLVCLNEVGYDAGRFGGSVDRLHRHNSTILARWPLSMTTTTTHDTKRSEDVRARLAVLSELPDEWDSAVGRLHEIGLAARREVDGEPAPSPDDELRFHQTVVGALPFEGLPDDGARAEFTARVTGYLLKAAHEAKERTSWINPNPAYDAALEHYVGAMLASGPYVDVAATLVGRIATYGACNSLAQLALRLASPGVPDVYQGCELWDLSLVDPDNRRPVDYDLRRRLLQQLDGRGEVTPELAAELVDGFRDGRIKLHLLRTGLRLRRAEPALFLEGSYRPIDAGEHLIGFERAFGDRRLVCLAPRLTFKLTRGQSPWPLGDVWSDTHVDLGPGPLVNAFTGERHDGGNLPVSVLLRVFPVAWLLTA